MILFYMLLLTVKWMKFIVFRDKFGDIKECFWNMLLFFLYRVNMYCIILNYVLMRSFNKKCRIEKLWF